MRMKKREEDEPTPSGAKLSLAECKKLSAVDGLEEGEDVLARLTILRWLAFFHRTKKNGKCVQPYTQEKVLAAQLQNLLQTVSLPLAEIEDMGKQIDLWEKESMSEKGNVAQNLKEKIRANEEKLNKLVSVFLR